MKHTLKELVQNTIVLKYKLPNLSPEIDKTIFTTVIDDCYCSQDSEKFAEIIYNSIVDYSFNEFEIDIDDYTNLHAKALKTKIRYNPDQTDQVKQKYGFYGEVVLHCILTVFYKSNPIIARGYFYNPTAKAETTGFDSYHLIEEHGGEAELWFGEVKFYQSYVSAINKALGNIDKVLNDEYLGNNILAFENHRRSFNIKGSKIETILDNWSKDPSIKISEEIKKHNLKLIYPILLIYEKDKTGFDKSIENVVNHIKDNYSKPTFSMSVDLTIFFILVPVENVKKIKQSVIEWIESKKPLI